MQRHGQASRLKLLKHVWTVRSDRLACGRETGDEDGIPTMLDGVLHIHSTCASRTPWRCLGFCGEAWGLSTVAKTLSDAMEVFEKGLWMDAGDTKTENHVQRFPKISSHPWFGGLA
ncbi:MAG: hypothetical protein QXD61_08580 [Candidatus Caldarchaeum sp.]